MQSTDVRRDTEHCRCERCNAMVDIDSATNVGADEMILVCEACATLLHEGPAVTTLACGGRAVTHGRTTIKLEQ